MHFSKKELDNWMLVMFINGTVFGMIVGAYLFAWLLEKYGVC